jgi:hypothetical protein
MTQSVKLVHRMDKCDMNRLRGTLVWCCTISMDMDAVEANFGMPCLSRYDYQDRAIKLRGIIIKYVAVSLIHTNRP